MHLVMFDIDGTLVDSSAFDGELYARAVLDELGVAVDRTWRSYRHVTDSGVLEELLRRHAPDDTAHDAGLRVKRRFIDLVTKYLAEAPAKIGAIRGAPELVRALTAMPGFAVAIATGGWRETAELKLAAVGIDRGDIPLATSSDATSRVEIMRLAERMTAVKGPFSRKTYFGDAPWDQQASQILGYDFVAVGPRVEHAVTLPDLDDRRVILEILGS